MIKEQAQADIMRLIDELLATKEDSRIKLFLITQALKARKENLIVFQQGDYVPLAVGGKHSDHIIAFARSDGHQTMITIAPRFFTRLIQPGEYPLGLSVWDDTHIQLPPAAPSHWQNTITGQMVKANNIILVGEALQHFPVALCCKL